MSETRVFRGRWWLADRSSDESIPGTLTLSDDEFLLDLEGTLLTDPAHRASVTDYRAPVPIERILGENTDGTKITLEECDLAQFSTRGGTSSYESYWPSVACVGGWFLANEPLAFDQVFVRLSSLHAWTAVSGFDPMWQSLPASEGETSTQSYTPPPERRAELHDGTIITLSFPLKERTQGLFTFEKTFTQATRFAFAFSEPRELEAVRTFVFTLRNFLTLAVGEGVKVTELIGYRARTEKSPMGREVEIIYQHVESPNVRELPNNHRMLFTLSDIADGFEAYMVRWFENAPELGRVLDLYFSTLHAGFVYLETRFMNFAQAIEGYHRRRLNRFLYTDEDFKAYRATILKGVSGEARHLVRRALGPYANEISLKDRIKDVLQLLGDPATSIVAAGKMNAEYFAERAAQIRNIYAHNLESEEPDQLELVVFKDQLKTLVEALLLHEIGFEPRTIDEKLQQARRYELIQAMQAHRRGPWKRRR